MGYYSTGCGFISLKKQVPVELVDKINGGSWNVFKLNEDRTCIIPKDYEHKYYYAKEELVRIAKLLLDNGINATGEIEVSGEESGDCWKIGIYGRKNTVYVRDSKIVFSGRKTVFMLDKQYKNDGVILDA